MRDPLISFEPSTAAEARALHKRRALIQAVEHGFALLDALDMPPAALDTIDQAIAALDALDAPNEDLESYLAGYCGSEWCDPRNEAEDADSLEIWGEGDFLEDAEDDDPAEETSLETYGRGFVRCGPDDAEEDDSDEDSDPAERGEEYGSEDGEDIGHHASQFRPQPLTRAQRAEVGMISARVAVILSAAAGVPIGGAR